MISEGDAASMANPPAIRKLPTSNVRVGDHPSRTRRTELWRRFSRIAVVGALFAITVFLIEVLGR